MIYRLRAKFAKYFIRRILKKEDRPVKVVDFSKPASIGILFKDVDEQLLRKIEKMAADIKSRFNTKKIDILGYTTKKSKNLPVYITKSVKANFFTLGQTNFFLKPNAESARLFMNKKYDVLIDFSKNKFEPLKYITALTPSSLKIGRYAEQDEAFYDLMLNLEEHKTEEEFFKELVHYLGMINDNNEKK